MADILEFKLPPRFDFAPDDPGLSFPLRELPTIIQQRRKKPAKANLPERKMMGADTETVNGRVWLFSTEKGVWEIDSFSDLMDAIYQRPHLSKWKKTKASGRGPNVRGFSPMEFFFYNLKFDAQAVLRLLDDEVVLTLLASREREGEIGKTKIIINADTGSFEPEVEGRMVELDYLEGKSFVIRPQRWMIDDKWLLGACWWWDISQFYGRLPLKVAGQQYLGETKIETLFDGSVLDASRFDEEEYRDYYREDIDEYAIQDAILAGKLARLKREHFIESGVRFIKPYSIANVSQRACLDTCSIPTVNAYKGNSFYLKYLQQAHTAYLGGWFECVGSGFHPSVQSIDLASAYPYVMYHLPDIMGPGVWIEGAGKDSFMNWLDKRKPMTIGFAEVAFMFDSEMNWHPLAMKNKKGTLITPRFARGWFTADEISEAMKWPHSQMTVGRWFYFSDHSDRRPFAPFVERFYKMKMEADSESVEYMVAKILANSLYGKTVQAINGRTGKLWNPLYAATITGSTRARMAECIRLNNYSSIQVATDGIVFPKESLIQIPNRPLPAPYNLGQWELEDEGDILIMMSGVYSIKNKEKTKSRYRGHSAYFLRGLGEGGLFGFCNEYAELSRIVRNVRRPYSIKQARAKGDLSLTNVFTDQKFSIQPAGDINKRYWLTRPQTFGDLTEKWWPSLPHINVN